MIKIISTGKTLASDKFLEKRRRARKKKFIIFCSLTLIILIGAIILLRRDEVRIDSVEVYGNKVIRSQEVAGAVLDSLSGYYLLLIPRNSALLYSNNRVESDLFKRFPRFNLVDVSLSGLKSLTVDVVEREPLALYCKYELQCYFLDETGFIFDLAPTFSEGVYFIYSHENPFEDPVGQEFVDRDEFWELDGLVRSLESLGISASSLELGERDVTIAFNNGSKILFHKDDDKSLIFANLEAFLQADQVKGEVDFLDRVSELDLRTENKVFWKVK